jgi:hypothetical protein
MRPALAFSKALADPMEDRARDGLRPCELRLRCNACESLVHTAFTEVNSACPTLKPANLGQMPHTACLRPFKHFTTGPFHHGTLLALR